MKQFIFPVFAILLAIFYYLCFPETVESFFYNAEALRFSSLLIISFISSIIGSVINKMQNYILGEEDYVDKLVDSLLERENGVIYIIILVVIIAPLFEEFVFRVIPHIIIQYLSVGGSFYVAFFFTFIWVVSHGRRSLGIIPAGIFYYDILINGLIFQGIIIHVLINFYAISIKIVDRIDS